MLKCKIRKSNFMNDSIIKEILVVINPEQSSSQPSKKARLISQNPQNSRKVFLCTSNKSKTLFHVILSQTEFTLTFCQFCIYSISFASKNENPESVESFQESHLVYQEHSNMKNNMLLRLKVRFSSLVCVFFL